MSGLRDCNFFKKRIQPVHHQTLPNQGCLHGLCMVLSMARGPRLVTLALNKVIHILSDAVIPDCSLP